MVGEARAEDVLQHALLAAWAALRRGDEVRDLRPWLHRIVHNTSLNALRGGRDEYAELRESMQVADAPEDELERRAIVRDTLAAWPRCRSASARRCCAWPCRAARRRRSPRTSGSPTAPCASSSTAPGPRLRAAATAITPLPVASWLASVGARAGEPAGARIAELASDTGSAGIASALAKAGVVVVLAGGAAAGPSIVENSGDRGSARAADVRSHARGPARGNRPSSTSPSAPAVLVPVADTRTTPSRRAARHRGSSESRHRGSSGSRHRGSGDDDEDRSGPGGGGPVPDDSGSGSSGSGSGGDDSGHSGSGSGSSGSGSSGSGSSGSGSGSGSSGSGSSSGSGGSGSNSGSGSSGSGSSGSGSGVPEPVPTPVEVESESSGSGSSGSGSSGSGGSEEDHSGSGKG